VPKDEPVDNLARMFRALGNPNRLRLFMNLLEESKLDLAKGRVHDCFLVKLLGGLGDIGAPTVSHHVKELADAGLLPPDTSCRPGPRERNYSPAVMYPIYLRIDRRAHCACA
jgi:DNA-binding transcriptional ArsR family regulator